VLSQPIYQLIVLPVQKWLIHKIDQIRRAFLWKEEDLENVRGGHCLGRWTTSCKTKIEEVWEYWTWNILLEPFDYSGYGSSDGNVKIECGGNLTFLVKRLKKGTKLFLFKLDRW
jgi:hypothetical protein